MWCQSATCTMTWSNAVHWGWYHIGLTSNWMGISYISSRDLLQQFQILISTCYVWLFYRITLIPISGWHISMLFPHPAPNPCSPPLCSHLCLLSPVGANGFTCACPAGMVLDNTGRNCVRGKQPILWENMCKGLATLENMWNNNWIVWSRKAGLCVTK